MYPQPFDNLIAQFSKLPGVGPRMAERLTLHLFKQSPTARAELGHAMTGLDDLRRCAQCFNISDQNLCVFCRDTGRQPQSLCVVEDSLDIIPIERTGIFSGRYHVLGGVIAHGPQEHRNTELTIPQLLARVTSDSVTEIILAMNPTAEGDFTILQLTQELAPFGVTVTQLGRGLATGSDIEHADDRTLRAALTHREEIK